MITVEIPKKELLRQLPEKAGYALFQWLSDMPTHFTFEAAPVRTKSDELAQKYPELYRALTAMEWCLLLSLYKRGKVTHHFLYYELNLAQKLEDGDATLEQTSNVLAVHVKNLRKQIQEIGAPLRVVTFDAALPYRPGAYKLIELA